MVENEQVKDAIDRKKKALKLWCTNRSMESKNNYGKARNITKKVNAKVMKQETKRRFQVREVMRKEGRDIEGGVCIKDKDGRLVVSEKDRGKLWKEHMEKIMNVENEWDQMVEADMIEEPVEGVTDEEVMEAMNKI